MGDRLLRTGLGNRGSRILVTSRWQLGSNIWSLLTGHWSLNMRLVSPGLLAFFVWLAAAGAAMAACTGATVLFQDNFDQLQPTWGEPNETMKLENGQLVVK